MPARTAQSNRAKPAPKKPELALPPQEEKEPGAISGNMTSDPELRYTPRGRPVANFQVASNDRVFNDETGAWEDTEPEFTRVVVWGQQAENVCESFQRGDRVVVVGHWEERSWETKEGEPRTTTELIARDVGASVLFKSLRIQRVQRSQGRRTRQQDDDAPF